MYHFQFEWMGFVTLQLYMTIRLLDIYRFFLLIYDDFILHVNNCTHTKN
jgi:hypothetical protein